MQSHAVKSINAAETVVLIAAPQAGSRIRVVGLHISVGGAAKVTLSFSAGNQRVWNLAANSGPDIGILDLEGDDATALSLTSSAAVEVDVTVDYYVEAYP